MEVTRQLREAPRSRSLWLNSGYDLVSREGRVFAVESDALAAYRKRFEENSGVDLGG